MGQTSPAEALSTTTPVQPTAQDRKELTITVSGASGSGKTTVACLIEHALRQHGVEVEFNDDGAHDDGLPPERREEIATHFPGPPHPFVRIRTEQAPRADICPQVAEEVRQSAESGE